MRRPPSLGRLWYLFRRNCHEGWSTWYWRDRIRPRILATAPIADTTNPICEIHALTSHEDWLNLVWALKSFYRVTGRAYTLCIHDDGSLTRDDFANLRRQFPAARIIERRAADDLMRERLASYPRALAFRLSNPLAPKAFDFFEYLRSDRMLLIDSDVLFFSRPNALIERIESIDYRRNTFNADFASAYTVSQSVVSENYSWELQPCINSGLALIHRDSMPLEWVEEFLGLPGVLDGYFWRIEQTLFALCSSRYGVELLPAEYTVRMTSGSFGLPIRHYVGHIRYLMYREGIKQLVRSGILAGKAEITCGPLQADVSCSGK